MANHILLVDDDNALRQVIAYKLQQRGFAVTATSSGEEALEHLRKRPFDALLSDIKMPKMTGVQLLARARELRPELVAILMTAYATISQAVEAVKLGASDYLTKPFEDEQLFVALDKALNYRRLENENRSLKKKLQSRDFVATINGVSPKFKELMALVRKVAPTDATALITGESGVGKEVVARALHHYSNRSTNDFIAVNCAAIPRELIESELFGHVKGAFTGAVRDKRGKFELAEGGTLLLDEIGELSLDLQVKLLRVMQEKTLEPVGAEESREVDFRLIAATNADLRALVAEGRFREDLFYRLNVIPIHVPPLRERREDISLLASGFLSKCNPGAELSIDNELMNTLVQHDWPGNIRELENLIERMAVLSNGSTLTLADLPSDFSARDGERSAISDRAPEQSVTLAESEVNLITNALQKFDWNKARAARFLDIPRHVLIYRMKKYNITGRPTAT